MKKITAIFLALAVLVLFASCDNNDNPTTTQGPIAVLTVGTSEVEGAVRYRQLQLQMFLQ